MHSPVFAIAWEVWRKNQVANVCFLALLPVSVFLFKSLAIWIPDMRVVQHSPAPAWPVLLFPMLASLMWVFHAFAHTEGDPKRGFSGMPARLFTLPVRTSLLVGSLVSLGVFFVALTYLLWAGVIQMVAGFALPLRWPVLSLAATMVCFQAVVWGLASFPWIRILVIAAGAFGAVALNVVLSETSLNRTDRETALILALCILVPLAGYGAWLGVKAERCGGWRPWEWLSPTFRTLLDAIPRRARPFATQARAQFWFEWARRGYFLSGALALSIAAAAMIFPITAIMDSVAALPFQAVASAMFYPLLATGLAGLGVARSEFWSKEVMLHPFQTVRPIDNAGLFCAKLRVAGGVVILGWLLAAPMVYAILSWSKWRELWRLDEVETRLRQWLPGDPLAAGLVVALGALCLVAATWRIMTAALCIGLSGNRRRIAIEPFVGCGWLLLVILGGGWISRRSELMERWDGALALLLTVFWLVKIFGAIRSMARVRHGQMLSSRTMVTLAAIWLTNAGILITSAVVIWLATPLPKSVILLALTWAWPARELFQSNVHLAVNRHR